MFEGKVWKAWQEGWVALHFARFERATHLQLAAENAADDFYLKRRGADWIGFQVTEAMCPGRRRSSEYREREGGSEQPVHVEAAQIQKESDSAIPSLVEALRKKSLSARGGHLVIYWNTGWLINAGAFIEALERESEPFRSMFREAWIIGKGSVFRVAPDFRMLSGPPRAFGAGA